MKRQEHEANRSPLTVSRCRSINTWIAQGVQVELHAFITWVSEENNAADTKQLKTQKEIANDKRRQAVP
jgi:nucleoid DNA-binding protein